MTRWLGVDVGGTRKGFDVAVIDERALVWLEGGLGRAAAIELIEAHAPCLVAIDCPRSCAPAGSTAREDERRLARNVCGIRWTPDAGRVAVNGYYAWILEGLALFAALRDRDIEAIEVFPTASWTRWFGRRGATSRSNWSRHGLARLGVRGLPHHTNQDQRDAVAAAVTARQHTQGLTEAIGEIVVPTGGWDRPRGRPARPAE
jgi:predicted nuclease with RNAse H fold